MVASIICYQVYLIILISFIIIGFYSQTQMCFYRCILINTIGVLFCLFVLSRVYTHTKIWCFIFMLHFYFQKLASAVIARINRWRQIKTRVSLKSEYMQIVFGFILQQFQNIFRMILQGETDKRKYSRPTYESRVQLINMVQKEGETIKNSAKILNIKESTAKLIVSRFRTCGTIYEGKKNHINRKMKSKGEKRPRTIKSQQCDNGNIEQKKDHRVEPQNNYISHQYCYPHTLSSLQSPFYYQFMPAIYYHLQIHPN